jgi:death-on-curing protein
MRYFTLNEVLELHRRVMRQSGGAMGIHSLGALESALAQPRMTFAGEDLYPTVIEKAAALGFSIINNHPFVDGNKRTGHAAMEIFLILNGLDIDATIDEQERTILNLAAGELSREAFTAWLHTHTTKSKN